jgi:predicted lipoprotein with Yx(FWY)xxD motif
MTRHLRTSLAFVPIVAVLAAGCGSGSSYGSGSSGSSASTTTTASIVTSAKAAPTLAVRTTNLGKVIVDSKGRTLYAFGHDRKNVSRCSGACATNWPPATAPSKRTVGAGVSKSKLKAITRSDGSKQLSYNGHPLYRFIGDHKKGDVNGQGINAFGGIWNVVAPSGNVITASAGSSSGGTTTTSPTYPKAGGY